MTDYSDLTVDQLKERRNWFREKGWDDNADAVEEELSTRRPDKMTREELAASGWDVAHLAKPGTLTVSES